MDISSLMDVVNRIVSNTVFLSRMQSMPMISYLGVPQILKFLCLCNGIHSIVLHLMIFVWFFVHQHLRCWTVGATKILSRSAILCKLNFCCVNLIT